MMNVRTEQVLEYIRQKREVTLRELCNQFPEVTEMTIRRDLNILQDRGVIQRTWGGASYKNEPIESAYTKGNRAVRALSEKKDIAIKAAQLLTSATSIFLDAGTTTYELSKVLPTDIPLFVVTNNPDICQELQYHENCEVLVTGGSLDKKVLSLSGPTTLSALENINIDIAFLSAAAVSSTCGFSNAQYSDCLVKQKVIERAATTVMLVDSTKMETLQPYTVCGFNSIDLVVTDKPLPESLQQVVEKHGLQVIC